MIKIARTYSFVRKNSGPAAPKSFSPTSGLPQVFPPLVRFRVWVRLVWQRVNGDRRRGGLAVKKFDRTMLLLIAFMSPSMAVAATSLSSDDLAKIMQSLEVPSAKTDLRDTRRRMAIDKSINNLLNLNGADIAAFVPPPILIIATKEALKKACKIYKC
jgi:hypothetical protein